MFFTFALLVAEISNLFTGAAFVQGMKADDTSNIEEIDRVKPGVYEINMKNYKKLFKFSKKENKKYDSSFAFGFSGKPNGGDGGNGGFGIVTSRLIKKHSNMEIIVGQPGSGGIAHPNLKGEKGEDGVQCSNPQPYQVKKIITL